MSIIVNVGNNEYSDLRLTPEETKEKKFDRSEYTPTDNEKTVREMIIRHFTLGYLNMYKPRREFNDMSVIGRMTIDQMSFNTYQPNNGEAPVGDTFNNWRSNAIRPIVRNKCISIAAHATAQLIFPKVFAYNKQSDVQEDAATVTEDLMEWAADQSHYEKTSLNAIISAIVNPAAITYSEYGEVYRNVKREKGEDGTWKVEKEIDEDLSGFTDSVVPVDELFIENFYENDIQKQSWLIWRRVMSYDLASTLFGHYKNWKYVKPGMQVIYDDPNNTFYEVYDSNMRTDMVEVVWYWNKKLDVKLCMVNAVLLSDFDNPNPRNDKLYPFSKFGYENIDEGKCFYYKSLAFKMQSDANVINTLYPMIVDGTYLDIFRPMVNYGSETISSDVIIPGKVTTLSDPNSKFQSLEVGSNMATAMNTLAKVEESINESSEQPILSGQPAPSGTTAYEISRQEQNANTILGLFIQMISQFVRQYGRLRMGDIIQYLTIVDADKITDNPGLVYKSFLVKGRGKDGAKKIEFTDDVPDEAIDKKERIKLSYGLLATEKETGMTIYKANPRLYRELCYKIVVTPDVMHPRSEDLMRAMNLELYDRAIANPLADQEMVFKDFLLGAYSHIKRPDDYIASQPQSPDLPEQVGQMAGGVASPLQAALPTV